MRNTPKLYRVILPAKNIEQAAQFYRQIFGEDGRRVSPGRHYFDTGGVVLALVDLLRQGPNWQPHLFCRSENRFHRKIATYRYNAATHSQATLCDLAAILSNYQPPWAD